MNLKDLFVSHKQVEPVSFIKDTPELPKNIYFNLDRAQKVANPEDTDEEDTSSWSVDENPSYKWTVGYKAKDVIAPKEDKEDDIQVPYIVNPPKVKGNSSKLQKYREGNNYQKFKQELDIFIKNNPKYASIKDNLDYLAALESAYNLGVENHQGSGALGWFQFMDNTRQAYNNQSRKDFATDAQSQLMAAAKHYTGLQNNIKARGGDPNDFVTMYGAWWRPESAYAYLKDNTYNYTTKYGESLSSIRKRAQDLIS